MAGQHPGAHLHTLGAKDDGGRRGSCVAYPPCRDDRQVDAVGDQGEQDHRRGAEGRLETAALHALDHQGINACVRCLHCALQRSDHVHDGHACLVEPGGEQDRITRGGEHVPNLGHDVVDDGRIALPALDHQVRRHWPVGEFTHPAQVSAAFRGQRLDHAEATALGDRGGQFGPGDIRHRCLDDWVLDTEQGLDAVRHRFILCQRLIAQRLDQRSGRPVSCHAVACPSGLRSTPRKRVTGNPRPRVQIPPPPP